MMLLQIRLLNLVAVPVTNGALILVMSIPLIITCFWRTKSLVALNDYNSMKASAIRDGLQWVGTTLPTSNPAVGHYVTLLIWPQTNFHWWTLPHITQVFDHVSHHVWCIVIVIGFVWIQYQQVDSGHTKVSTRIHSYITRPLFKRDLTLIWFYRDDWYYIWWYSWWHTSEKCWQQWQGIDHWNWIIFDAIACVNGVICYHRKSLIHPSKTSVHGHSSVASC